MGIIPSVNCPNAAKLSVVSDLPHFGEKERGEGANVEKIQKQTFRDLRIQAPEDSGDHHIMISLIRG